MAAVAVVADEAAEEAVVGGGDAVVVVEVELGEGGDVDVELAFVGEAGGEFGVEGMDAFEDDDLVFVEPEFFAAVEARAGMEIEGGQVDFAAGVEVGEVAVEDGDVDGVEVFEVVVAGGGAGGSLAVDEIVVGAEGDGAQAVDAELDG